MNGPRINTLIRMHAIALVTALSERDTDPRITAAARAIADLADYADRSASMAVTLTRRGFDSPSFQRQLDEALEHGPDLRLIEARTGLIDLDTERARRRGPQHDAAS